MENKGFFKSSIALFKSRKDIIIGVTWTTTLASIIAGNGFPPITESFLSIIASMMIVASVYIYNDVVDREMDAYSEQEKKKARPIAHGIVSDTIAMRFVVITGILGLGACLLLNRVVFSIGVSYYVLVFLYSYPGVRFKAMFIIKNLVTSLLFPVAYLIGGAAVENVISQSMFIMAFTYYVLTVLIIPSIADMLDYDEDLAYDVKTLGNSLSWKQNLVLYNLGLLILILGNMISYFLYGVNILVPVVSSLFGLSLMVYSIKLRNESGVTASYKLRPISFTVLLLNPLLIALSAVFS